ncbi:Cas1p-domain-containing protein [Sodiomyces alkalinus F11]|uniref:Cas1p-domain-containing protein n=1 Tax=Sodiomyces alkalinus (strain CBS 110278 / VKM F-3762 / F11) TaxID=1314773 RepID=A0A3N2PTD6_SODAK|nr:Cas1p-domain-containing protein [Sodiomyces alkalinus F11]ROT37770.1 Cas1p-domain-containing protein [Sodiomyces alkalinus F11]
MKLPSLPLPAVPERAASLTSLVFAAILLAAALINHLSFTTDPYRCGALLRRGSWLDPPNEKGDRAPFRNWQPDGCMLRKYNNDDIRHCMDGRHMVFSGDSTTRQVFWGMARLLDSPTADQARKNAPAHSNYDMTINGVRLVQIWNPYLDSGEANRNLTRELDIYREERANPVPVKDQKSAAIIMLGVGGWFALHNLEEEGYRNFTSAIDNVTGLLAHRDLPRFGTRARPMHPLDGTGNEVFLAPVHPPWYDELPEKRKTPEGIQVGELESYNEYLAGIEYDRHLSLLWSFPALSQGQPETIVDRNDTGFHVVDSVAETKATILLNLRCNAKLDAMDGYPHDRTCCTDYGRKPVVQQLLLFLGALYVAACVAVEARTLWRSNAAADGLTSPHPSSSRRRLFLDFDMAIFVATLLCCYYFDRTQMLPKGSKQYVPGEFQFLCGLVLLVALLSLRRSHAPPSSPPPPLSENGHAEPEMGPFLSRDQTDEWKGWIVLFILICHWTGAQALGPQVVFRLCVAAYLFQTGYGHATYFLTKKDFSFHRVAAATLLRLNLLSCALSYVMNTDYTFYYFAPLVSFWFLVVWATMAIGSKYNFSIIFVSQKILLSMVFVLLLVQVTPFPRWAFALLRALFGVNWDVDEWEFRLSLDPFIVFVGMATAVAHQVLKNTAARAPPVLHYLAAVLGVLGTFVFWLACSGQIEDTDQYTQWHPYASFLPILGFVAVRNIPGPVAAVRTSTSRAMAWVGRCSLEVLTLHFHLFLGADTKGVLRVGGLGGDGSLFGDRWRDLVFIVPFLLWISSRVAEATGRIVRVLTDTAKNDEFVEMGRQEEGGEGGEPKGGVERDTDGHEHGSPFSIPKIVRDARSKYSVNDLRVRMGILLGVMWLLNLIY